MTSRTAILAFLAYSFFSFGDAGVKLLLGSYSIPQVVAMVYGAMLFPLVVHLVASGHAANPFPDRPLPMLGRSMASLIAIPSLYHALSSIPLAEAYCILFATPLCINLLGALLLGERVGASLVFLTFLGFSGVLVAMPPGLTAFSSGHVAAVVAMLALSTDAILVRHTSRDEAFPKVNFWPAFNIALAALLISLPEIRAVSSPDLLLVLGTALLSWCGVSLLNRAFRLGPVSVAAPMQYMQLVWGTALGSLLFGTTPSLRMLAGGALVLLGSMLTMSRVVQRT